jgi:large subunit ribosomal protein L5
MGEYIPRLQQKYRTEIVPALMKQFSFENQLEVPRLEKVTLNMGLGEAVQTPKIIEAAVEEKPVVTRAKKSIATFKLRQGMPIGVAVTLRKERMWEFVDRLITLALPRVRDFRGVSTRAFDGRGNYTLGIREQIIFPEINYDKIDKIKGMSVNFGTSARTDEHGRALLAAFGMPFRK